ncbi:MAG: glutathione S-transferase C-terminal domain-containing protein [Pseudomonadota bacterium]
MGLLVEGVWTEAKAPGDPEDTPLQNWITPDGAPGPTGHGGYRAEPGRYRLYVSYGCPFSHRVLMARALLGLEDVIATTDVIEVKRDNGWEIAAGADPVFGATRLHEVIAAAEPGVTGRAAVPILVDEKTRSMVSVSSQDIVAMLSAAFAGANTPDLMPGALESEIKDLNQWITDHINIAVYKTGLAPNQTVYEQQAHALFDSLDRMEARLSGQPYLHGEHLTASDLWLFATLIRLDTVYGPLFKCTMRRGPEFPHLWGFVRRMWARPAIVRTVDFERMKQHYFLSLIHTPMGVFELNPSGLVPLGPDLGLDRTS